jgi:cytochrome P450
VATSGGLLGVLGAFRSDPLSTLRAASKLGDVVRLAMGHPRLSVPTYLVVHPDGVRHVLVSNAANYRKSFTSLPARSIFGLGLLTSDGPSWVEQRRIVRPVFRPDRLDALRPAVARTCDELLERWQASARRGDLVDLGPEMARTSLEILLRSTFGVELAPDGMRAVARAFPALSQHSWRRAVSPLWWFFPRFAESVPTIRNREFHRAQARLDRVVRELAARPGGDQASLLSVLRGPDENGRPLPRELIRDEIVTFLIAGHETTATSLAWVLYLLARSDAAWERLRQEVSLTGHRPGAGDFTRAVVTESLRLYPPAWSIVRDTAEDDEVDGTRLPAGSVVITSPFVTQRDPRFWERPDEFVPQRFEARPIDGQRPQLAYFPFGAGMRHCVGEHLAMQQMLEVVARIARRFRPVLLEGAPVLPKAAVTLRPSRPIMARLEPV